MRAPNNLNALRAFEAVSRHLNHAAAEELNATPAAVGRLIGGLIGRLIRGLEDTLGASIRATGLPISPPTASTWAFAMVPVGGPIPSRPTC